MCLYLAHVLLGGGAIFRARKSTQTFFGQSFSRTLRVMDVRTKNRGRPHRKVRFPAAPAVGRNFLTPGHPGVRVRNVRRKFGPKSLCLCCFLPWNMWFFPGLYSKNCGIVGVSQTCLGTNVPSGLVPSTVFLKYFWAFLGPCVGGRRRPWYGTSAQLESHFTCSSPRCAPRVVPSTFLLHYFWAFLGVWGVARGRPWYGTFAKPTGRFTEGMQKCWHWWGAAH